MAWRVCSQSLCAQPSMQSAARAKVPAGRHVDLQMKDRRFEKESLTAVMRAFMLEHEINGTIRGRIVTPV